jgi:hypothetical protein
LPPVSISRSSVRRQGRARDARIRNPPKDFDMQKITPFLWYAKEAEEAATFYASVFPDSRVTGS